MSRRLQSGSVSIRNGKWTGRYLESIRFVDGEIKRIHRRIFLGTKSDLPTKRHAVQKLAPYLAEVNDVIYKPKTVMTFQELFNKWETTAMPNYRKATRDDMRNVMRKLLPRFGARQLAEIRTEMLQTFIAEQKAVTTPAQIKKLMYVMHSVWKLASRWGYVTDDPFLNLILPSRKRNEQRCFSSDEAMKIINQAEEPYKTLYWILAQTGLRIGEALALTWENINLERGTLTVQNSVYRKEIQAPKTAAAIRTVPISNLLVAQLKNYRTNWKENSFGLLFATRTGRPCSTQNIMTLSLHPILAQLGIPRAGFHAFRHASATILDRMNVPMKVRQQRMGHVKAETTLGFYTHTNGQDERNVADRFDEVLGVGK